MDKSDNLIKSQIAIVQIKEEIKCKELMLYNLINSIKEDLDKMESIGPENSQYIIKLRKRIKRCKKRISKPL